MSHFTNVEALLQAVETSDTEPVEKMLESLNYPDGLPGAWDWDKSDEMARSILYLLVTFKAGMHKEAWKEWRDKVSARVVEEEVQDMFWSEDD